MDDHDKVNSPIWLHFFSFLTFFGYKKSYVEEFWNESYLQPDASVVLNLNPYFVLEVSY